MICTSELGNLHLVEDSVKHCRDSQTNAITNSIPESGKDKNYKGILCERFQKEGVELKFNTLTASTATYNLFYSYVCDAKRQFWAIGKGSSKKNAEKAAAYALLQQIEQQDHRHLVMEMQKTCLETCEFISIGQLEAFLEEHKKIEITKATSGFRVVTPSRIFGDSTLGKVLQSALEARICMSNKQNVQVSCSSQPEDQATASHKRSADFEEGECSQQQVESKKLCNHLDKRIWKSDPQKYLEKLVQFSIVPIRISSESFDAVSFQYSLTIDVIQGSFPVKIVTGERGAKKKIAKENAYYALLELLEETFGAALAAFNEEDSRLYESTALNPLKASNKDMSFLMFYHKSVLEQSEPLQVQVQFGFQKWKATLSIGTRSKSTPVITKHAIDSHKQVAVQNAAQLAFQELICLEPVLFQQFDSDSSQFTALPPAAKAAKSKKETKAIKETKSEAIEFQVQLTSNAKEGIDRILSQFDDFQQAFEVQEEKTSEEDDLFLIPSPNARNLQLIEEKNQFLQAEAQRKSSNPAKAYPIVGYKQQILQLIDENRVIFIRGVAGCGKTTQVPAFLLEQYSLFGIGAKCNIVVAEPRRIAATAAAYRVAEESGQRIGEQIGYNVRFNRRLPNANGSILFATNGILLRMLNNPDLFRTYYTHIILDEVHERTLQIDLLLFALKVMLRENSEIKIILMSGTMDEVSLGEYFQEFSPKSICIPHQMFPIKEYFLEDLTFLHDLSQYTCKKVGPFLEEELSDSPGQRAFELSSDLIAKLIVHILREYAQEGDILVFLPGLDEIRKVHFSIRNMTEFEYGILHLHSILSLEDQQKVFQRPLDSKRRIILSTNIAESSVTIEGVNIVVDCLQERVNCYDAQLQMKRLVLSHISRSSQQQRKGRAGRVRNGFYFALGTRHRVEKTLSPEPTPEMQRLDLNEVCLELKNISKNWFGIETSIAEILEGMISPPPAPSIEHSMDLLTDLGALTPDGESLTPMGRLLGRFPLSPQLGKMLLLSCLFGCLDSMLTLVAILSEFNLLFTKNNQNDPNSQDPQLHWALESEGSELISYLTLFNTFKQCTCTPEEKEFCRANFLNYYAMLRVCRIRYQLHQTLVDEKIIKKTEYNCKKEEKNIVLGGEQLNANSQSPAIIKAIFLSIFHKNIAVRPHRSECLTRKEARIKLPLQPNGQKHFVKFHPSGTNFALYKSILLQQKDSLQEEPFSTLFCFEKSMLSHYAIFLINSCRISPTELFFVSELEANPDCAMGLQEFTLKGALKFKGTAQDTNALLGFRRIFELVTEFFYHTLSLGKEAEGEEEDSINWTVEQANQQKIDQFLSVLKVLFGE